MTADDQLRPMQELNGVHRGLIVLHTAVTANRLLPIYEALAYCNPHVRWHFTVGPDHYNGGVAESLAARGIEIINWKTLLNGLQPNFGVALAAAFGGLETLTIPVVKLTHGALNDKTTPRGLGLGAETPRQQYGLGGESLQRHGREIATRLVVAHEDQLAPFAREQNRWLDTVRVMGDPLVDQIDAHLHLRDYYRKLLGVEPGMKLVVVTSTAGPQSLWRNRPEVLDRLVRELPPDRYRIIVIMHPHLDYAWRAQLDATLGRLYAAGVRKVPADQDWAVALIAADWVIGDHGSVLHYATRTPATLLTAGFASGEVEPGSARALLGRVVPELADDRPLEPQLLAAAAPEVVGRYADAGRQLSSCPGEFAANLRRELHHLLHAPEPDVLARMPELVVPTLIDR
ncbi:hypothetical protein [Kutzneria sp. 744]|uniref:hypothetical protein n=1 Tax=Kutzneria sp. (strain 744) TaxID=345341 RepID=UPI0003EEB6E1|nr:hypothetical protein [Kutzneria sp. 744]EWM12084.1 LigA protein [Kutzneria sp. 744]